jgi:hypothetical protein
MDTQRKLDEIIHTENTLGILQTFVEYVDFFPFFQLQNTCCTPIHTYTQYSTLIPFCSMWTPTSVTRTNHKSLKVSFKNTRIASANIYLTSGRIWLTGGSRVLPNSQDLSYKAFKNFLTQPTEADNEKQTPGVPGHSIPLSYWRWVFSQAHSFIFWQKVPYAKQDSSHVQTCDPNYLCGPPMTSWAVVTTFPFPPPIHWAPEKP